MTEIPTPQRPAPPPARLPVSEPFATAYELRRPATLAGGVPRHAFAAGVAGCSAVLAAFLLVQLSGWPPHEDETLALFVGRGSLGELLSTVLGERGGAPLHFLLAAAVGHGGGGLIALRVVSAVLAIASVPVVAILCARLADRTTALVATVLASASWIVLFHGIYGRMYSLFLLTSALSYLALVVALDRGGVRRFGLWTLAILATLATHPYGALVLASQVLFVLAVRQRVRQALVAIAAVAVLGIPFWRADLVLAGRFEVGVGAGVDMLAGPLSVVRYLWHVAGDFSVGFGLGLTVVLGLALLGLWHLARERRRTALLVGCVFGTPALALLLAELGSSTSPESRHLIFALPFFTLIVAAGVLAIVRALPPRAAAGAGAVAVVAIVGAEVAWAWHKTPALFEREPQIRVETRAAASEWLARTTRRDDVFFGYDPLFLGAWERSRDVPATVVPRADAKLALEVLRAQPRPLGRAVFAFDRSDTNNWFRRLYIPDRYPEPKAAFDAKAFGPFLVIRTRARTGTPARYLRAANAAQLVGLSLYLGDADVNYVTVQRALARLRLRDR